MAQKNFSTGITEIDAIEDSLSTVTSEYQITLENASIVGQPLSIDIVDIDLSSRCYNFG